MTFIRYIQYWYYMIVSTSLKGVGNAVFTYSPSWEAKLDHKSAEYLVYAVLTSLEYDLGYWEYRQSTFEEMGLDLGDELGIEEGTEGSSSLCCGEVIKVSRNDNG